MEWIWTFHDIMKPSNFETTYTEVLKLWDFFFNGFFLKLNSVRTFCYLAPQTPYYCNKENISMPSPFSASGSFPMSRLFKSGSQSIRVSASPSVLPMNIQGWFPLGLTGLISLLSKGFSSLLQDHSSKATIRCSDFFTVQLSHPYMTIGNTITLTIWPL